MVIHCYFFLSNPASIFLVLIDCYIFVKCCFVFSCKVVLRLVLLVRCYFIVRNPTILILPNRFRSSNSIHLCWLHPICICSHHRWERVYGGRRMRSFAQCQPPFICHMLLINRWWYFGTMVAYEQASEKNRLQFFSALSAPFFCFVLNSRGAYKGGCLIWCRVETLKSLHINGYF